MSVYRPVFSIDVEHTYFSEGRCTQFDFIPTHKSRKCIERSGFVIKPKPDGIRAFFNANKKKAIKLYAEEAVVPPRIDFSVFSRDTLFRAYTEIETPQQDSILYFDSQGGNVDATDRIRLHVAKDMSAKDREPFDSPWIETIMGQEARLPKPVCVVSILLRREIIQSLTSTSATVHQVYYLKFKAKKTFWRYYLLGSLKQFKAYIVDLSHTTDFENTGQVFLSRKVSARTFRSTQKLSLREKSEYRFQLREKNANGGKVLIKRLPVASAQHYSKEFINGQNAIVSEIFING